MSLLSEPILVLICINLLLTLSLLFPFMTGVWSLGMPGFMAVGAYASAYCSTTLGLSIECSLLIGTLTAIAATTPFGLLALRIRGIYLAIATLAAAELITLFFSHFYPLGGVMGFAGMPYLEATVILSLAIAAFILALCIYRSQLGLAMLAAGSSPLIAACTALHVPLLQLTALALGGLFAGLAGGIFAHYYSFIAPNNFTFHRTVEILLFLVAGGLTPLGALLGSTVLTLVPQYASELEIWAPALYAAIVIVIMSTVPEGLFPRNRWRWIIERLGYRRRNPRSMGRAAAPAEASQ